MYTLSIEPKPCVFNLCQDILAQLNRRPLECQCTFCTPGLTFQCSMCKKQMPYCQGQDDEHFELCTRCWYKEFGNSDYELNLMQPLPPHIVEKLKELNSLNSK